MKMNSIIGIALFASVFLGQSAHAQCNPDESLKTSVTTLADGFNFVKSYTIAAPANKESVEFSYVFTKGTQYMLTLADAGSANSIVVTLYDSERRKVASNKIQGTIASALVYPCNATGIYYMEFSFDAGSSRCGASALGFKK